MKFSIFDCSVPFTKQSQRWLGAMYCQWELQKRGMQEVSIENATHILCSCVSVGNVTRIKTLKKKNKSAIIIVGGPAAYSPYIFMDVADVIVVGDGSRFFRILFEKGIDKAVELENVLTQNKLFAKIDNGFPYNMPPMKTIDGTYRVFCGKGCKGKCNFCQTGWAIEYSENPDPGLLIRQSKDLIRAGQKIQYVSNDLNQHSFSPKLPNTSTGSVSVKFLKKYGLPAAREVRLGIEGVSQRLRDKNAKPISNKDLVDLSIWLSSNSRAVKWFLIAGLPSEHKDDWGELREAIKAWKKYTSKGVLHISFTTFTPQPATPFSYYGVNSEYWENYEEFADWFFHGKGYSNRIRIYKPEKPENRDKNAILYMGNEESVYKTGVYSPNISVVEYPHRKLWGKRIEELVKQEKEE